MVCGYASLPNSEASGSHAGSLKMAMARAGTGKCSAQAVFIPTEPVDQRATMPTHPCEIHIHSSKSDKKPRFVL